MNCYFDHFASRIFEKYVIVILQNSCEFGNLNLEKCIITI